MKIGDLVNFCSTVESFHENYINRNPGLVVASELTARRFNTGSTYILWANSEITKEHVTYLKKIDE